MRVQLSLFMMAMANISAAERVGSGRAKRFLSPETRAKRGLVSKAGKGAKFFDRVATFPVCRQFDEACNTDEVTVAEIVVATDDGMTLIYTDSEREELGFVNITDAHSPLPLGTISMPGEPTSVGIKGNYALVAVNTSPDYLNPSGDLVVVDILSKSIVRVIDAMGQPDAVSISPDKRFCAIAIENERDEDLGDGILPQLPAGFVVVLSIEDEDPNNWPAPTKIDLVGLDGVYEPTDPEPEFISINEDNIAVVTLQENNAAVLIDIENAAVLNSFSLGAVDLTDIDTQDDKMINQVDSIQDVVREPDGVTWLLGTDYFATANEGDMLGGSRGFTIFDDSGGVKWDSGNTVEHIIASIGHYADKRSDSKGVELENVIYASDLEMLFVVSERSHVILVYDVNDPKNPVFHQVLPSGFRPEGGCYIPSRQIYVSACEEDSRGDKIRGSVVIYQFGSESPQYPTLISESDNGKDVPISWAALSGLSGPHEGDSSSTLYAVDDSAFLKSRIFYIDASSHPAMITHATHIKDSNDVLAGFTPYGEFSAEDLAAMINEDRTVNIDSEGIAAGEDGGFWIVSEGNGNAGDDDDGRPVKTLNFLFKVDSDAVIEQVISLPDEVNDIQQRYGFEGVAKEDDYVVVAFQRAWRGEDHPRIGIYSIIDDSWKFVFYPLDAPESQNGGWVGLSEITSIGTGDFLVLERDNQGGPDAAVKRIYSISLGDISSVTDGDTITKLLVRDVLEDTRAQGGLGTEKLEGLAYLNGDVWMVNDNDAVDDNTGETQLINLGNILP